MEDFFKNLKSKLSIENVIELVEDGKVIDEDHLKENIKCDVEHVDPNNFKVTTKLSDIRLEAQQEATSSDNSKIKESDSTKSTLKAENSNQIQQDNQKRRNTDLNFFF
ncbi:uncharacterized protein LOC125075937 [Vanessa atalanta]|uniref:uncharacterized protein LOC125075937 n=1 Tax=Vanessa atalanta TaxID=42275 RepID=UPI001FCD9DA1|nr:uncharacterized protein LOC125075937 [Vanessa atalanta]